MNFQFVYPMFAMVVLTFTVAMNLLYQRIQAFRKRQIHVKYFSIMEGGTPPECMIAASRHFTNLFEVPVLFYAACVTAMVMGIGLGSDSKCPLTWAWAFVFFRVVHAVIHLTKNPVRPRMVAFLLGCVCVLALWIEIVTSLK